MVPVRKVMAVSSIGRSRCLWSVSLSSCQACGRLHTHVSAPKEHGHEATNATWMFAWPLGAAAVCWRSHGGASCRFAARHRDGLCVLASPRADRSSMSPPRTTFSAVCPPRGLMCMCSFKLSLHEVRPGRGCAGVKRIATSPSAFRRQRVALRGLSVSQRTPRPNILGVST